MGTINLNTADTYKSKVNQQNRARIKKLYEKALKEIQRKEKSMGVDNKSLRKVQLQQLENVIKDSLKEISDDIEKIDKINMMGISQSVFDDFKNFYSNLGVEDSVNFYAGVDKKVVNAILNGKVYEGKWKYSSAIWKNNKNITSSIEKVVADGILQNKSTIEIAENLEKYVDPSRRKPWKWSKVYPGSSGTIDYNAQRLARTLVSHAYQYSIIQAAKDNPFIKGIKWRSALIHGRTCSLCRERNGKVYQPDDLPLDHPNGLCTMIPVTEPLDKVGDRLIDWVKGKEDKEINRFAYSLMPDSKKAFAEKFVKQAFSSMNNLKKDDVVKYTKGRIGKDAINYDTWITELSEKDKKELSEKYSGLKNAYNLLFKS